MQLYICGRQVGPNQRFPSLIPRQETPVTTLTKIPTKVHATSYQSYACKHMTTKNDIGTIQVQTPCERKNKPRTKNRKTPAIPIHKVEPRFLIDCIPRNEVIISDPTPLPNIKEILNWTAARIFKSKLDLTDGYHNIRIHPDSVKHSTIVTHMGLHDSQVMQQGDKNASATMIRVMNHLLRYQLDRICKIYIDNIIIATHTYAEHKKAVREIMRVLEKAGMWFNNDTYEILSKRLYILGFIMTEQGLEPNPTKIDSIRQDSRSTTRKRL